MRPPYLSVHMPSGTRISEPVSTGVAVSRPNSVALRPSVFLIGMPITPNIIHTMKHTVNASVLMIATDHCFDRRLASFDSPMALTDIAVLPIPKADCGDDRKHDARDA